jgi:CPA2 family monovalent cation:H+ antiporter-2
VEDFSLLTSIAVALALALTGGIAARLAGLSPIVGYLVAGAVISPFTPGYDADLHALEELAELGVIFLMFGVGLHFNVRDLLSVRNIAVPGAILQILAATGLGVLVASFFGLGWREGVVLGLAISVASTVVLIKALEDRAMLESVHGRVAVGWLVVEDLATVLFLVVLPFLKGGDSTTDFLQDAAIAIGKAGIFLALGLIVGARLMPRLLALVARTGSRELFILAVVAIALGIATGAAVFGLSVAIGAFVAGVVVSETETSSQAAADVIPLREAFAVLFFVSVGMLLDPAMVRDHIGLTAAVLAIVLFGKALIAMVVAAAFPYPARTGLVVAAGLAQVGEFSFIVAGEGLDQELISNSTYNVILAVSVISIMLNPLAYRAIAPVEKMLKGRPPIWRLMDRQGEPPTARAERMHDHAVICGFGRVGELTGHAFAQMDIPFVVIEADLERSRRLAAAGTSVVWGDCASSEILERASVAHARMVVIATPDESSALLAVTNSRRLNPGCWIIVRGRSAGEVEMFRQLGANEVVVPELEGGLELMRQSLIALGNDPEEALHLSHAMRDIHYMAAEHG